MDDKVHGAPLSSEAWPIAAAMLPFPPAHDASADTWCRDLEEVAFEGFTHVDVTDSWVRVGDLAADQRGQLADALAGAGLRALAVSAIRASILDPESWRANLDYSHRTIDAAAELGCQIVSVGLHRPLTAAQREAFWFWTEAGPVDDGSAETWAAAVTRLRELGRHAGEVGVQLSLEMYEDTLLGSADSAVRLVQDIGLGSVGLNPDLANIYRLHRRIDSFLDSVRRCLPHANYWHVKSYYRDADPATSTYVAVPAPMASGSMDYRTAIKVAISSGFAGPFCVEHYGGDGLTVMADNQRYLRKLLAIALREGRAASHLANATVARGAFASPLLLDSMQPLEEQP